MCHITAINLPERLALLSDGRLLPITNLFDICTEDTDDTSEAVSFVAGMGREWYAERVDTFNLVRTH